MRRVRGVARLCQLFLCLHKQQSRQRVPTASGFAFVPNRTVFSDGVRRVIEPDSEASVRRCFTFRPNAYKKRDAPSPTEEE